MKHYAMILFAFIAVVFAASCELAYEIQDAYNEKVLFGQSLYYSQDFESLKNEDDIYRYISARVKYRRPDSRFVSGPQETLESGYGDCKALTVLYMNIAFFALDRKYSAGAVDTSRTVVNGGIVDHCIVVRPDGSMLDPQIGNTVHYELGYIYSFDEIFSRSF